MSPQERTKEELFRPTIVLGCKEEPKFQFPEGFIPYWHGEPSPGIPNACRGMVVLTPMSNWFWGLGGQFTDWNIVAYDDWWRDMQAVFPTLRAASRLTGGSSSYYQVHIPHPTSGGPAYSAECNDIIEALDMSFAEGEIFKALWRMAAQRAGRGKPGNTELYDAEKIEFFAKRRLAIAKWRASNAT